LDLSDEEYECVVKYRHFGRFAFKNNEKILAWKEDQPFGITHKGKNLGVAQFFGRQVFAVTKSIMRTELRFVLIDSKPIKQAQEPPKAEPRPSKKDKKRKVAAMKAA